jgi:hypothetical protein
MIEHIVITQPKAAYNIVINTSRVKQREVLFIGYKLSFTIYLQ